MVQLRMCLTRASKWFETLLRQFQSNDNLSESRSSVKWKDIFTSIWHVNVDLKIDKNLHHKNALMQIVICHCKLILYYTNWSKWNSFIWLKIQSSLELKSNHRNSYSIINEETKWRNKPKNRISYFGIEKWVTNVSLWVNSECLWRVDPWLAVKAQW